MSVSQVTPTSATVLEDARLLQSVRALYQTDHQVEFLYLQAQVEALLTQLRTVKKEKALVASTQSS